jgi:hypothetical protein
MSANALWLRYLPTVVATLAIAAGGAIVVVKIESEVSARAEDAMVSQWNETERLALAWGHAVDDLARALGDLDSLRLKVDAGKVAIRYVEPRGPAASGGAKAVDVLAPGEAFVLRTGSANRFEGRLPGGGFVRATDLGMRSFPTPGEGMAFLRRPVDGVFFVVVPRGVEVVVAALPPLLLSTLRPEVDSVTDFAVVTTAAPWLSSAAPGVRGPRGLGQIAHTNDVLTFSPEQFVKGGTTATLLEGPSRFELAPRRGAFALRLSGMGSAPVRGTNLRLVTRWGASIAPQRVLFSVGGDLGLVAVAALLAATLALIERARFLAAARGLREGVRALLYRREGAGASDWSLSPLVRDEFRDVLRNVDRITAAHRSLHAWGRHWGSGFDVRALAGSVDAGALSEANAGGSLPPRQAFLPALEAGPGLGLGLEILHDEEWSLHIAVSPALDAACLLVMRKVDFRTDFLRALLTHAATPLLRPGAKVRKETARDELAAWIQRAGSLTMADDPVVWAALLLAPVRDANVTQWRTHGPLGNAGFRLVAESTPMRLQWGDEIIAELTLGAPPEWPAMSGEDAKAAPSTGMAPPEARTALIREDEEPEVVVAPVACEKEHRREPLVDAAEETLVVSQARPFPAPPSPPARSDPLDDEAPIDPANFGKVS